MRKEGWDYSDVDPGVMNEISVCSRVGLGDGGFQC